MNKKFFVIVTILALFVTISTASAGMRRMHEGEQKNRDVIIQKLFGLDENSLREKQLCINSDCSEIVSTAVLTEDGTVDIRTNSTTYYRYNGSKWLKLVIVTDHLESKGIVTGVTIK